MPNSELGQKILAENEALRTEIGDLSTQIEALEDKGRHTRWISYVLIAAVTIVIIVWGYSKTNSRIDDQARYDRASCERGNATRAAQRQQWLDTRNLLQQLNAGKRTVALANGLVANANKNFPDVDCAALTAGR